MAFTRDQKVICDFSNFYNLRGNFLYYKGENANELVIRLESKQHPFGDNQIVVCNPGAVFTTDYVEKGSMASMNDFSIGTRVKIHRRGIARFESFTIRQNILTHRENFFITLMDHSTKKIRCRIVEDKNNVAHDFDPNDLIIKDNTPISKSTLKDRIVTLSKIEVGHCFRYQNKFWRKRAAYEIVTCSGQHEAMFLQNKDLAEKAFAFTRVEETRLYVAKHFN